MENEVKNTNLDFWNKYKQVPQNAMKAFDNGKFKGTDINTMWRLKCLTETFGMCGFGWYYNLKRTWVETTNNNEQFAFAEIELFIKQDNQWSMPIVGTGGNKLTRVTKTGEYSTSDEAFKMAITDAIGVACRNLGIGADVYWENDKTKYTEGDRINKQEKNATKKVEEKKVEEKKEAKVVPQLKRGLQNDAGSITNEQLDKLQALGIDIPSLLEYMEIPSITDLSKDQAQAIIFRKENK